MPQASQQALQVRIDDAWQYVFCRNERYRLPIVAIRREVAVNGSKHALEYFQGKYAHLEFRAVLELLGVQKAVIAMWQKTSWANLPDLAIRILTKAEVQP